MHARSDPAIIQYDDRCNRFFLRAQMTNTSDHTDVWSDDLLGRKKDAEFLSTFLVNRVAERQAAGSPSSYVLNLNASWGHGKTYFLERFEADLLASGHVVASVNAWRDDYADDPLLSVMAAIDRVIAEDEILPAKTKRLGKQLGAMTGQVVAAAAKGAIKQVGHRFLGDGVREIADILGAGGQDVLAEAGKAAEKIWDEEAKSLLDKFKNGQKTIEKFKSSLASLVDSVDKAKKSPVFILIDELDRCRPTYAVALLERVKHLFDVNGVVFVIATDTDQLQHAIGKVYGAEFESKKYLNRFFDSSYTFEAASYRALVKLLSDERPISAEKVELPTGIDLVSFFSNGADFCGLSLRDIKQAYELLANVATVWEKPYPLQAVVLVPLVFAQVLSKAVEFSEALADSIVSQSRNVGRMPDWRVAFRNLKRGQEEIDVLRVFKLFLQYSRMPLGSLFEHAPVADPDRWVAHVLQREAELIASDRSGFRSAVSLSNYPSLVKSVGRVQSTS